ncbi:MAG TPA: HEAT repeat domain-containing protein [Polyangiaceae bacterium]
MAESAWLASRFWQLWTLFGVLGTTLAGARLLPPEPGAPLRAPRPASPAPKQAAPRLTTADLPATLPSVDPVLARLAIAATASERCTLLERVQPSEDSQATYAITALLERAQLASVRSCATQALGLQSTSEATSFLVDLAEDPEPEVHRNALEALALRENAARAVVVEATHSEDLELRTSAVKALLKAKRAEGYVAAVLVLPLIEDGETLSSLIDALGESHDPQAFPVLESLLESAERDSHLHAISALGELGVASAAARLESLLEVGSDDEFSAAAEALNKLTPLRAAAQLKALLASRNSERQELALSALLSLNLPDLSSILRQQLASRDPGRTFLVLRRLIRAPDPEFEAELIALAERGDFRLRLPAMQALGQLSTPTAPAALERLTRAMPEVAERLLEQGLGNPDQLREQRIAALAKAESVQPNRLLELARDPSERAQTALLSYLEGNEVPSPIWALVAQFAPLSTVQRIVDRSTSNAHGEKPAVLEGLGRRGDPSFTAHLRAELRADPPTRNSALAALAQLGDDSILPELQQLALSSEVSDRTLAVRLLSTREDAEASRELERLAADPEPQIMSDALHTLQARSPELVGRLAERALREGEPERRANLLSLLSDLRANLSRPLLERSLSDTDDSVAVQAIQSLGNLPGAATAQRLLSVVNDANRSEEVRREAASGLRSLGGPLARANRALLDSLSEPEAVEEFVCSPN